VQRLEKVPVHLKKEVDGFLLNRIFRAISREAMWILDMGVAIGGRYRQGVRLRRRPPHGTVPLNDLTGIDLSYIMGMEASGPPATATTCPPPAWWKNM
jgi:3-hydroxybutyryl-CoA dehydrogenase